MRRQRERGCRGSRTCRCPGSSGWVRPGAKNCQASNFSNSCQKILSGKQKLHIRECAEGVWWLEHDLKWAEVGVDWEDVNQLEGGKDVGRSKKSLRLRKVCLEKTFHLWDKGRVPGVPHLPGKCTWSISTSLKLNLVGKMFKEQMVALAGFLSSHPAAFPASPGKRWYCIVNIRIKRIYIVSSDRSSYSDGGLLCTDP